MDAMLNWAFEQDRATRGIAVFLLAFIAAALLFMVFGSVMLLFGASYSEVLAGALGCGLGTGLVNGIATYWWKP